MILIVVSFLIQDLMNELRVHWLLAINLALTLLVALTDIAVDSWSEHLLLEQNLPLGSFCQLLGQILGGMIAYSLYIFLNSPEFCQKLFGFSERFILINPFIMIFSIAIFVQALNLYIHFWKDENPRGHQIQLRHYYRTENSDQEGLQGSPPRKASEQLSPTLS